MARARRLVLMRHAKAAPGALDLPDHERPLLPVGVQAAAAIAAWLASRDFSPQYVLCSTSRRTRETWQQLAPTLGKGAELQLDGALYSASPRQILARVAIVPDDVERLLVVGHNPGIGELARQLAGGGSASTRDRLRRHFPTAAVAELRWVGAGWDALGPGDGELVSFVTPGDLRDEAS